VPDRALLPYVGVSGVTSANESIACIDAWREAWAGREPTHDLMLGVLASTKTLAGQPNRYPRRYPKCEDIAECFVGATGILNLLHLAMDLPDIWDPRVTRRAVEAAGPRCSGVQINIPTPTDDYDIGGFSALLQGVRKYVSRVVLQVRPSDRTVERIAASACFNAGRAPICGATDLLIDGSGGAGRSLDVDRCESIVAATRRRTVFLGYGPQGIGVAGGLSAESVGAVADLLRHGISIDAEGKLRDDADGGGNLDLDKVRAYLRAAVALIAGVST
jgi:hypothetical protein